jgi:hypothetical protein
VLYEESDGYVKRPREDVSEETKLFGKEQLLYGKSALGHVIPWDIVQLHNVELKKHKQKHCVDGCTQLYCFEHKRQCNSQRV